MNRPIVIDVKNVYKAFPRHKNKTVSLRHEASNYLWGLLKDTQQSVRKEQFYALSDVSFTIQAGECVGIIGRNGSGKTTLLRLMSNLMQPTSGSIQVTGNFASLIGLGTGFIPILSGRKNIYLNAAFYGLRPSEVDNIVDQIIEFADIGEFIDEPVKDYSSGMKARLGFSVAFHILPEIIFLDEILAVGDEDFRQKSSRYLKQMIQDQKTVVMVSHSLYAVLELCDRIIWIDKGVIMKIGKTQEVIDAYFQFIEDLKVQQA